MIEKIISFFLLLFSSATSYSVVDKSDDFTFKELTIPYLQSVEYKSTFNELNKIDTNSSYSSYLTSYTSDGLKINALLTVPNTESDQKFPAIVFIHGYIPPLSYKTTEKYVSYIDRLAESGFVVLKIDLRGHSNSEGEAGGAYYSSDYIIDTLNAYSALSNFDKVDPERIGLWGHSMAGNVVLRSLVVKQNIKAAVIWAGAGYTYTDLLTYGIGDNSYRPPQQDSERARKRRQLMQDYGQFDPNSWFWKQVPATNYLFGISTNIQIHHAVDDDVVSVEYSRNLSKILKDNNINHSYLEYSTGGHNITGATFSKAMDETIIFFNKYLQ